MLTLPIGLLAEPECAAHAERLRHGHAGCAVCQPLGEHEYYKLPQN